MTISQVRVGCMAVSGGPGKNLNGQKFFFSLLLIITVLSLLGPASAQAPGAVWSQATSSAQFPARYSHTSVVFDNRMWVVGGVDAAYTFYNDTWNSTDGVSWTRAKDIASFPSRFGHTSVVFDGKMWVIGGFWDDGTSHRFLNDTWYSTDGIDWIEATDSAQFPGRYGHTSVVFDGKMWVIGGYSDDGNGNTAYLDDVWYSTDGVAWTQAKDVAAFPRRFSHTSVAFDGKMWVIGGTNDTGDFNDAWSSADGVDWTEENPSPFSSTRYSASSVATNDGIWVIGGYGNSMNLQEVWNSTNGADWYETAALAAFPGRNSHTSVIFDNRMWVIGGAGDSGSLNDVWYSSFAAAPDVTGITPASGINTGTVTITDLAGTGFETGATVKLNRTGYADIPGTGVTVDSATKITCAFDLSSAAYGQYNVVVTNPDGRVGMLTDGFTVTMNAPAVTGITPATGVNTRAVSITDLSGSNFVSGAHVMLNRTGYLEIVATGVTIVSPNKITCSFDLTGDTAGQYNVVVTNPDGQEAMLVNGFTITVPQHPVTAGTANTTIEGLTITNAGGIQHLSLDTGILPAAFIPNASVLEIQPPADRGFRNVTLYALDGTGFSKTGTMITGSITGVHLESAEFSPTDYSLTVGPDLSFNYTVDLPSYPVNALLRTEMWEGTRPDDHTTFFRIAYANGASYLGTAYTVQITKTNLPPVAGVELHMSVNESWNPAGGQVFVQRIADDRATGEALHTRLLYHDPVSNLDYYEADSPNGLSTFGLSSLSGNNNPFQLIVLAATSYINQQGQEGTVVTTAVPATTVTPRVTANATSPPPPPEGRTAKLYTNANGTITQTTTLQSADGFETITLGTGVTAKDSGGKPLSSITLTPVTAETLPGGMPGGGLSFTGRACDLRPEGASFSPNVSVVFKVPPDTRFDENFAVKEYDMATGSWKDVPASFDASTMTITSPVSHFCCIALFTRVVSAESSVTVTPAQSIRPAGTPKASYPSTAVDIFVGILEWAGGIFSRNAIMIIVVPVIVVAITVFLVRKRRG